MSTEINTIGPAEMNDWDTYVYNHPRSTLYHLSGWRNVIHKAYGHKTYYLMANKYNSKPENENQHQAAANPSNPTNSINPINRVVGILPLMHLKHFFFGNSLISIPF